MARLLRSDQAGQNNSLADLDQLIGPVRDAGLRISTAVELGSAGLSRPVASAAYRVVQEALTNVLRHSGATRAEVRLVVEDDQLVAVITDNGGGRRLDDHAPGQGLIGMRERVGLLGGTVRAGDGQGGGFVVEARLPLATAGLSS
jgi:signal transduction histidine kinase